MFLTKNVIMDRLYYSVLPFRVWNYLFLCERSQYMTNMCRYCTKLYIKNKKISDQVNNNLFVHINEFPTQLKEGIWVTQKKNLFVHSNIAAKNDLFWLKFDITFKNDLFGLNFGSLYHESINSHFLLWKAYLDILCRIVFSVSHRFNFLLIVSGIDANCRGFTVCSSTNCSNLKINKVKAIFFREFVFSAKNYLKFLVIILIQTL